METIKEYLNEILYFYAIAVSIAGFIQSLIFIKKGKLIKVLIKIVSQQKYDLGEYAKVVNCSARQSFEYDPVKAQCRQVGTSTGLAMSVIGRAMLFPGIEIVIKDHCGTHASDILLYDKV